MTAPETTTHELTARKLTAFKLTTLEPFFDPKGIAVVGASANPHKLGHGVIRNLIDYNYGGPIYPVNPRGGSILGQPVIPSVSDLPDPVDLAVIIVPAAYVVDVLEQCGRRGIRNAIGNAPR